MKSREIGAPWPNGIRLVYRQVFWCGHSVPVWSNRKDTLDLSRGGPNGSPVHPELKKAVLEMGCVKCAEPYEPLDWPRSKGGFLAQYAEKI